MTTPDADHIARGATQSYNVVIERRLPLDIVTSVGYVGTRTDDTLTTRNLNYAESGGNANRKLFAQAGTASINLLSGNSKSRYNSLQVAVNRAFKNGFLLKGADTLSKAFGVLGTPEGLTGRLEKALGRFPFQTFWGPMAGLPCTRWIARAAAEVLRAERPDLTLVYLPHLDYDPQRFGPQGSDLPRLVRELDDACSPLLEAAQAVGGFVAHPAFGDNRPEDATDFNDIARHCGAEAVKGAIEDAARPELAQGQQEVPNATAVDSDGDEWLELQSLTHDDCAKPYPVDSLPQSVREAIEEVRAFTQAPVALIAVRSPSQSA